VTPTLEAVKQARALYDENSKKIAKLRTYRNDLMTTEQSLFAILVNQHHVLGLLLGETSP
jgi:hypothetical protein